MDDMYRQWREADRKAHELELWIRSNARKSNYIGISAAELDLAKQLRAEADKLFQEAMSEMHARVNNMLAKTHSRAEGTRRATHSG